MLAGFKDGLRPINTDDIVLALSQFKSLFEMRKSDFEELREWAVQRCRMANATAVNSVSHGQGEFSRELVL